MTRIAARARTILIVEDDDDSRRLLGRVLTGEGYRIELARNGLEGLRAAHACRPDLILLDVEMPVMDGVAFREHQLGDPTLARIPVVCVSALDRASLGGDLGLVQFVRKPLDFDRLLSAIVSSTSADSAAVSDGPEADAEPAEESGPRRYELVYSSASRRSRWRVPTLWRIG
jgi:CheY-like chemotaxis protein